MSRFLNRFSRPPSGSPRRPAARAAAEPPVAVALDRWLDAQMPGRSTPGAGIDPVQTLSGADRSAFASLAGTFYAIDRLDVRAADGVDDRLQARLWEDIMQAMLPTQLANPVLIPFVGSSSGPASPPPSIRPFDRPPSRTGGFARLSPVLNVAMAALLVLVLGLSAWAVTGHRPGGSGEGPGGTEGAGGLASLAALDQNTTPVAQGILPTADECTIQPLTIDQVMERIRNAGPNPNDNAEATPIPVIATPPVLHKVPPSQEDIDTIAAVQREFVACTIKGAPLQVWAFYAPYSEFWRNFLDNFPRFSDEATVRAAIDDYVEGAWNPSIPGLGWDTPRENAPFPTLPLVNPDPQASLVTVDVATSRGRDAEVNVAMVYYTPGKPDVEPVYVPREQMAKIWVYTWDEASQMWMISQVGLDVNRG